MNNLRTNLIPTDVDQALKISEMFAKSDLVPDNYRNKPANIFLAVSAGASLGLAPFQAMQNITVINGKPSIWGDALLAMVRNDKRCLSVKESIEGEGTTRTATCSVSRLAPNGETEVISSSFSMGNAQKAGLLNKKPWQSYPDRMLQMRARGFALRDAFADVIGGLITTEEAQDYPMKEAQKTQGTLPKYDKDNRSTEDIVEALEDMSQKQNKKQEEKDLLWSLNIPGKPALKQKNKNDFVMEYRHYMELINRTKLWDFETKKKKYNEYKTLNMEVLEQLRHVDFGLIEEIEMDEGRLFDAENAFNS
tara:strand:- start:1539 stop:2459 length:921 start_codon:yes stop_codon:yes gene_type:complete